MRKSILHVIWLLSYISIASVSAAIITPALPQIQVQFGLSLGAVEWMISAFLMGYVIGQLIYGPLANRYGRLASLRIGLVINLVGILICLIAFFYQIYWLLIIGRLISALGAASGLACTYMLINEWLPEVQRKTAMAYSILSFALGAGFAVMIGGIITEYWHWQGCFWFLLVYGIVMLFGVRVFSETLLTPRPIQILSILRDYSIALKSRKLVIYSLVLGICSSIAYCFSAAAPQIAHNVLMLSAAEYGYWNGINILGMLLGGLLSREILNRLAVGKVIAIGFMGCACGILSLIVMLKGGSSSSIWFFVTTASLYLFSSFLFAGGSYVASNALTDKASAAAMMSFVNMGFATLAVVLMGYISTHAMFAFIIILSAIWLLVGGLLLSNLRPPGSKPSAQF